jgi:hypothetical protein
MRDIRAPWMVLGGMATLGFFMILLGFLNIASDIRKMRPLSFDLNADSDVWLVLDEARRITEQAAAKDS